MFSYAQAVAVTDEQLAVLSGVQKTALALVLTPREDRLVDFRGECCPVVSHGMRSPVEPALGH